LFASFGEVHREVYVQRCTGHAGMYPHCEPTDQCVRNACCFERTDRIEERGQFISLRLHAWPPVSMKRQQALLADAELRNLIDHCGACRHAVERSRNPTARTRRESLERQAPRAQADLL